MDPARVRKLLQQLQKGKCGVEDVVEALRQLPFEDLGDAKIDHHRQLRRGVPEIIFGQGKTPEQVIRIGTRMMEGGGPVLATRLADEALDEIARRLPRARLHREARVAVLAGARRRRKTGILVCCAGTTDIPVAEEAAITLEALGHDVGRLHDVGVAGLHRLTLHRPQLAEAAVIIAVAGMEGALPSVLSGMVSCPVIGVPTSVGYGTALGGITALLAMLNSCAGGLVVVNIDNGVGAALAADLMRRRPPRKPSR